ncbi:unnamed protein product, partial [Pocillopora meandrina]
NQNLDHWEGTAVVNGEFKYLKMTDSRWTLRQITMNDLPVGRSVDETLRLVQAFQYTDKHGEVCPAGWKPGKETIIPDPTEKKKYFAKQTEGEDEEEKK